ncbi:MAG: hypothetical protein M3P49_12680 [Actinomycetota bacterium]|nr:hypothetical protein [Actinomycetota bacterium]
MLVAAWGVGRDVSREGHFHPVMVFSFFSFLIVLVDLTWMVVYLGDEVPFFAYTMPVAPDDVLVLAREQVTLFVATYAGYLLVRGVAGRESERAEPGRGSFLDPLWPFVYLIGVGSLLAIILSSGGFSELLANLNAKSERAAGRGELVLLQYFAYAGVLMWYRKNLWRPAPLRYGGLIALCAPMLLSGSRVGLLICLVAALYMDEKAGNRMDLRLLVTGGAVLALFFAFYQAFRTGKDLELFFALYKDLSMGTGYVVAVQEGIVGDAVRPGMLVQTVTPFIPTEIERLFYSTPNPNDVLTDHLFPDTKSTLSMGVMGEANFMLPSGWSFLYYLGVGVVLAWIGSFGWRWSLLLSAMVAGGAIRIAKSGFTTGGANILEFAAPVLLAYAAVLAVRVLSRRRKASGRGLEAGTGGLP